MIGVPDDDGREDRERHQPAEIGPGRKQPAPLASARSASQIRIAAPKNSAVYFDSSAAPTAAPTASHHAPRPVSSTFARKNSTKLDGHEQRRIRRHDQRADRRHQRDVEQDRSGRRHALTAEQDRGRAIDRKAHRQCEQDRHQPHAELGIARDHGAGADHEARPSAGDRNSHRPDASTTSSNRLRRRSAASRRRRSAATPPAPGS